MHRDRGETTITFEVTDTGVGITAEELENLFQPFVQTSSGQQLQQGTGLGLTISREFVRLMRGEITVISNSQVSCPPTSETPSGTTFKFDIPVGIADESEIENPSNSDRTFDQRLRSLMETACKKQPDRGAIAVHNQMRLKSSYPQILRMKRINNP